MVIKESRAGHGRLKAYSADGSVGGADETSLSALTLATRPETTAGVRSNGG